jgi:hypothetical protein
VSVVPECLAEFLDPLRQRVFDDGGVRPHRVEQLLLRQDAVPLADEQGEQLERLRSKGDLR